MMIVFGMYFSFGVFLKPMLIDFGWTTTIISGAFSLSMLVYGLLGIGIGGLNDKFGPRIMLSLSGVLLALGFLLMSQISTIWHLYLLHGLVIGAAVSCMWVPINSTIARWFVDRRTLMTGLCFYRHRFWRAHRTAAGYSAYIELQLAHIFYRIRVNNIGDCDPGCAVHKA